MTYNKPITINSVAFEEELLPSGRKLLHLVFKQKFGDYHYKWTPQWKGDYGVEKLFFKARETEEWNDYDGVWSKELKQASKEIPILDEIRLPFSFNVGEMTEVENERKKLYRIEIIILQDDEKELIEAVEENHQIFIQIGEIKIPWNYVESILLKKGVALISPEPKTLWRNIYSEAIGMGVTFCIWLPAELGKIEYKTISCEIASSIRSIVRKYMADYKAFKKGFEEI